MAYNCKSKTLKNVKFLYCFFLMISSKEFTVLFSQWYAEQLIITRHFYVLRLEVVHNIAYMMLR